MFSSSILPFSMVVIESGSLLVHTLLCSYNPTINMMFTILNLLLLEKVVCQKRVLFLPLVYIFLYWMEDEKI